METLIIYDEKGTIYFQASGNVNEPDGLPFIRVTIPHDKRVSRIDTSVEPHVPIFEDLPKSENELIKEQLQLMQKALDDVILGGI